MFELLTPAQMSQADQLTIDGGIPGIDLMEAAGNVLLDSVKKHFEQARKILILCGPGNNGGDGYVVARLLKESGRAVDLFSPLGTSKLSGDARLAFQSLNGEVTEIVDPHWASYDLIIDALFGAGLTKNIEGSLATIVSNVNASPARVLAVDLPSGINGANGQICGTAVIADVTATFFRMKPGHLLLPGKSHCRQVEVGQIGIKNSVLADIGVDTFRNNPDLWASHFPDDRMVVTNRNHGAGFVDTTDRVELKTTRSGAGAVCVDAASFVGSQGGIDELDNQSNASFGDMVVKAQQQELAGLFPEPDNLPPPIDVSRLAARRLNAVLIFIGEDTIIADGDGRVAIGDHTSVTLATTNKNDLIRTLVTDLTVGGMSAFEAACAATWIYAEAIIAAGQESDMNTLEEAIGSVIGSLQHNAS